MPKGIHCFEILLSEQLPKSESGILPQVIAAYGDEPFIRKETVHTILRRAGIDPDHVRVFHGEECQWIDVHDELATLSLFDDSARIAVVTAADKLVKDYRPQLEKWCSAPAACSLLILQLGSLPANTKLFKAIQSTGWCIDCSCPITDSRSKSIDIPLLKKWMQYWAESRHDLKLSAKQTALILDAVGTELGLLHQEMAKLALFANPDGSLGDKLIQQHVGSWRTRTTWEIADAVADGRISDAMEQLQRVIATGEHPAAIVPQIAWSLRRFGNAANMLLQAKRLRAEVSPQQAIGSCGFWGRDKQLAEQRLRRMGLQRASKLLPWLLELDLKIKGSHSSPSRAMFAIEEFCLRLL